uniref:Uncharacterized protein n=1 Tax=Ixodes ricinus TaxID=34613 RepID=A0A6B0UXZ4_IXORI
MCRLLWGSSYFVMLRKTHYKPVHIVFTNLEKIFTKTNTDAPLCLSLSFTSNCVSCTVLFFFCEACAYLPNYKQCIFSEPSLNGLFFDVFSRRRLCMFVIRPVNFGDFCFYPFVFFSVCKQRHRRFVFQLLSSARRLILSLQIYGNYGMFCAIRVTLPPAFSC